MCHNLSFILHSLLHNGLKKKQPCIFLVCHLLLNYGPLAEIFFNLFSLKKGKDTEHEVLPLDGTMSSVTKGQALPPYLFGGGGCQD